VVHSPCVEEEPAALRAVASIDFLIDAFVAWGMPARLLPI
jgi:hypothetical protein